jgi:hypothetical protein
MAHARRRAHDKYATFVDLETGMITSVRQRLDIIRRPGTGVLRRPGHILQDTGSRRTPRGRERTQHRLVHGAGASRQPGAFGCGVSGEGACGVPCWGEVWLRHDGH